MQEESRREPRSGSATSRSASGIDLAAVLAHARDHLTVLDHTGVILFSNRAPPGVSERDVVGTSITSWMTPTSQRAFEAALAQVLADGAPHTFEMTSIVTAKDYEAALFPVGRGAARTEPGGPRGSNEWIQAIVLSAHDVSERRHLERELRRANRALSVFGDLREIVLEAQDERELAARLVERTLAEAGYTGVWIGSMAHDALDSLEHQGSGGALDEASRVADVVAPTDRLAEETPVTRATRTRRPVVLDEDEARHLVARVWSGSGAGGTRRAAVVPICDGPHVLAVAVISSDRGSALGEAEARLLGDAADEIGQAIRFLRARTERRLLVEQLVQSQKMEAIGRIAAGVAHDFNNQLTSILGFADLLAVELEDATLRDHASNIVRAAERSAYLVAQLLAFARKGPFLQTVVDVRELLLDLVEILKRSLDKRISVRCEWGSSLRYVEGDAQQLENALLNLALNARDAMPAGGTIRFVATDGAAAEGDGDRETRASGTLRIDVIDEGTGIDAETQKRIFEPFFTTKAPGEGTGLGLSAVYGTLQRHRGSVEVESEPGRGSRFRLTFPARRDPPGPDRATDRDDRDVEASAGPPRILVIDDEPLVGALVVSGLRGRGYDVDSAVAPEEGIARFELAGGAYDLVLLDMVMPRIGGAQVFERLRSLRSDVPVLLMSGYSVDHESEALLARGAVGFLQKPFTVRDLVGVIDGCIAARAARAR